jgi:hypothetical protein
MAGVDGWDDLAWLLELNQGFYNAISLAAMCGLAEADPNVPEHFWLGPPIPPMSGNERVEPLVTAFPILLALNILGPDAVPLQQSLKRDPFGLYNNAQMRGFQVTAGLF